MFVAILTIVTVCIAGSAAYFSVYGLATTFHGTFWAVVIMGGSLEAGKLVTASYLYRFWNQTHVLLKSYMMIGVFALMVLTSTGIFGLLSAGYQSDSLPLKQIQEQSSLLESEKTRLISRKQQIDDQIANLPADMSRGRIKLINGFKNEQENTTARINTLDKQILDLKTSIIQSEAHIGPITYIAQVFGLNPDYAAKYLIYLIIFVFDPMAVALTIALNTAMLQKSNINSGVDPIIDTEKEGTVNSDINEFSTQAKLSSWSMNVPVGSTSRPEDTNSEELTTTRLKDNQVSTDVSIGSDYSSYQYPTSGPYVGLNSSLGELLQQYQYFKRRVDDGHLLSSQEQWIYQQTRDTLIKQGYHLYL